MKRLKRIIAWSLAGLVTVAALGGGGLVMAKPVFAMVACPGCYGLEKVGPRLHVERTDDRRAIERLRVEVDEGRARVAAFYGDLQTDPGIYVCMTAACERRAWRGDAAAKAYGASFIVVKTRGRSAAFFAHELAHIELHDRVGVLRSLRGAVPAWFDEGLSVVISRDARYLETTPDGGLACRIAPDGPLPVASAEWGRKAGDDSLKILRRPGALCCAGSTRTTGARA